MIQDRQKLSVTLLDQTLTSWTKLVSHNFISMYLSLILAVGKGIAPVWSLLFPLIFHFPPHSEKVSKHSNAALQTYMYITIVWLWSTQNWQVFTQHFFFWFQTSEYEDWMNPGVDPVRVRWRYKIINWLAHFFFPFSYMYYNSSFAECLSWWRQTPHKRFWSLPGVMI